MGRLDNEIGEEILQKGEADIIGLTRRLIADPEFPNKVAAGKLDDIRPCTACLTCMHAWALRKPSFCRMNPDVGQEREYNRYVPAIKKKVLVVGGGPAGMEAARVAATRGHAVVLCSKENSLGGATLVVRVVNSLKLLGPKKLR